MGPVGGAAGRGGCRSGGRRRRLVRWFGHGGERHPILVSRHSRPARARHPRRSAGRSFCMVDAPDVSVSTGVVRGTRIAGIDRYLGIPYAAAPFGERRFRPPEPAPAWEGVRDATTFGPTAPQAPYRGGLERYLPTVQIAGSDILTVNVWAPADRPTRREAPRARVRARGSARSRVGRSSRLRRRCLRRGGDRVRLDPVPPRAGGVRRSRRRPAQSRRPRPGAGASLGAPRDRRVRRRSGPRHRDGPLRGCVDPHGAAGSAARRRALRPGDPAERAADCAAAEEGRSHVTGDR